MTISIQYQHLVTIAYVDFSKAFDCVLHNKLFAHLSLYYSGCVNFLMNVLRVGTALSPPAE